ncbi:LOW QUALITY PROTEIN: hypothetical protein PHMEG_00033746 [Phytophthora megakarya]|uniref:Uncharacterized protein n=1 Tax=Phytophthora megakarya TaxID=4795 RepID=A0A225USJ0_9STRA|nr:LOW QUALITY PROTEIN: hypothetical protein PHMEG_00033746 [Phytophthora megakarya]
MEPTQQPEERLAQKEVKQLTSEVMIGKGFPPVLEAKQGGSLLSVLFKWQSKVVAFCRYGLSGQSWCGFLSASIPPESRSVQCQDALALRA